MFSEVILKGTKEESARLRWVQKAMSKDPMRPALEGFLVRDDTVIATDGFRIHSTVSTSKLSDHNETILFGKIPAGDFIAELKTVDAKYPMVEQLFSYEPACFEIYVNPKYLSEALQGFDGSVRLRFHGDCQPMEVLGTNKNGDPCHVVLMPMSGSAVEKSDWMPFTRKSVEETNETDE